MIVRCNFFGISSTSPNIISEFLILPKLAPNAIETLPHINCSISGQLGNLIREWFPHLLMTFQGRFNKIAGQSMHFITECVILLCWMSNETFHLIKKCDGIPLVEGVLALVIVHSNLEENQKLTLQQALNASSPLQV